MNRLTHCNLSFVSIVLLAIGLAPWCFAQDITGTWECTVDFNGRVQFHELSLTKQADGSLTGTWNNTPIEKVTFENNKLSFSRTRQFQDQDFTTNYTATFDDGKLKGNMSNDFFESTFTAARFKPMCPALGTWDIGFTVQDRDITAKLIITEDKDGNLAGQWTTESGEHKISKVKYQDNKLTFQRDSDLGNFQMTTTYEGMIKDNELTGKLVGDMGEWQANAKREGAPLIGTWEFNMESQFGPPTHKFVVYPDMSARYELFDGLIPVKNVKLDGDKVTFSYDFGFGDQDFTTDFTGKLDGDTITGEMSNDQGTQTANAKRVKEKKMVSTSMSSPLMGTWTFSREGRDGTPRTSTLKIKPDMTATYSLRDDDVPVTDLKIDGNKISFKVVRNFNDQEFTMSFDGMLDGDSLKLNMAFGDREPREMTGKKSD